MKKIFVLCAVALLFAGANAMAEEASIIDFTQLDADILPDANGNPTQNRRTAMDYSVAAPASYTPEQKAQLRTSLTLSEWEIRLNSSAQSVAALTNSGVRAVPVRAEATVPFAGKNIMGVRVIFPETENHAHAMIVPSFNIPAYQAYAETDDNGNRSADAVTGPNGETKLFEGGYGLVRNVGLIKAISVTAYGNAYPHTLYVLMQDENNVTHRYAMGSLQFDGWKEMKWKNPHYLADVRARVLKQLPLYPQTELPYMKFVGFEVARDPQQVGGDFISYFKDVRMIYDKAQSESIRDILEEDAWGIIESREQDRQTSEMSKFGQKQILRFAAKEQLAQEEDFTPAIEQQ